MCLRVVEISHKWLDPIDWKYTGYLHTRPEWCTIVFVVNPFTRMKIGSDAISSVNAHTRTQIFSCIILSRATDRSRGMYYIATVPRS